MFSAAIFAGIGIAAGIEVVEIERIGGLGSPEPERIDAIVAIAGNRNVERHGEHVMRVDPAVPGSSGAVHVLLGSAAETNPLGQLDASDFPRETVVEPVVGLFHLPAVLDCLTEHPVPVTDPVADDRQPQGRAAVEEAGRQTSETAIAETGVVLGFEHIGIRQAQTVERLLADILESQIEHDVTQQTPHEVLERQIAGLAPIVGLDRQHRGIEPLDEPVPQGQHESAIDERGIVRQNGAAERMPEVVREVPHDGIRVHRQRWRSQNLALHCVGLTPSIHRLNRYSVASGGNRKRMDAGSQSHGSSVATTSPRLPMPDPPYSAASVLSTSTYGPAAGTPRR